MNTTSVLDVRMKNVYTITNGVVTIYVKSKKHGTREVYCSQRDFNLISQHTCAQTDYDRHRTWSAMDMKVIFTQLGLILSLPVHPDAAYRPSPHP